MRILLTGATGYIGKNIAKALEKTEHEVFYLVRKTSDVFALSKQVKRICRYEQYEQLYQLLKEIKPELVIHLAGIFLREHSEQTIAGMLESNLVFPTVLLDAAEKAGCKMLINTGTYWQNYRGRNYNPVNLYAASKEAFEALTEYYIRANDWKVITLVLFDVYGSNDTRKKILNLVHGLSEGEELDMSAGEQKMYMCYIEDVVAAYLHSIDLIRKQPYGTARRYEIRGKEAFALRDIMKAYIKISGKNVKLNWGKRTYGKREIMEPEAAEKILEGWKPKYDLEIGLKKYEEGWEIKAEREVKMAQTPGGTRIFLKDTLPLEMPILIQIFPVYGCNFKCEFCIHSLDRSQHGYISDKITMELDLYQKVIHDIKKSGIRLKMLRFAAIGEPLMHKNISEMIEIAVREDIAESVDIVTNGSLLSQDLSDALIAAGLSRLRISIEGLNGEDYERRCGYRLNFEKFVENISYFYHHKKETDVYIKIIDYMVQREEDRKRFYEIFEPICDSIAIEHLTPTINKIDYGKISNGMELNKGQNTEQLLEARVCPQSFYMMQINPDGKVIPCCSMKYPAVLGNVYEETVQDIWKGGKFNDFRRKLLKSIECAGKVCEECTLYKYDLHKEDILDDVSEKLMKLYI